MTDPEAALGLLVQQALADKLGAEYAATDPLIRPSGFADYQCNVAMSLAKRLGRPPREIAELIAASLAGAPAIATAEVSGPGFINLKLRDDWIAAQADEQLADPRLGVPPASPAQRVVVDYSGPNVAKELHAGHLRATVEGDAIVRVLEYLGHDVIRAAHLGDWGTQFGMLIEHALDVGEQVTYDELASGEFTAFYQAARAKFRQTAAGFGSADHSLAKSFRYRSQRYFAVDRRRRNSWHRGHRRQWAKRIDGCFVGGDPFRQAGKHSDR